MPRTPLTPAQRAHACRVHADTAASAAKRLAAALAQGERPTLADAKILEAAGCYIRRNGNPR